MAPTIKLILSVILGLAFPALSHALITMHWEVKGEKDTNAPGDITSGPIIKEWSNDLVLRGEAEPCNGVVQVDFIESLKIPCINYLWENAGEAKRIHFRNNSFSTSGFHCRVFLKIKDCTPVYESDEFDIVSNATGSNSHLVNPGSTGVSQLP